MMARMVEDGRETGAGERAEQAKRRKLAWTIIAMAVAGMVTGALVGYTEVGEGGLTGATIPGWLAIALTALFLATVGFGTWFMKRHMDEHEMALHIWSSACGGSAFAVAFPAWFLLWKGRLATEPDALILFGIFYAATLAGYVFKKYR